MSIGQNPVRILVCDDQMEVREALRLLLKSNGYTVETFESPASLLAAAANRPVAAILLDMNYTRDTTSGAEGLELIEALRDRHIRGALIAMTAWGDVSIAVSAMQAGASDFVEKPWNNDRLLAIVARWVAASLEPKEGMAGARRVQQNLLPRAGNDDRALCYACRFLPALELSGDYYDFFEKRPGHFGFVVADVSGKGVPAALLMANLQALFRSHTNRSELNLVEALREINLQFYESTAPESFATAFYADFDEHSSELTYINCGHPAALLRRADGQIETLEPTAHLLGAFSFWQGAAGRVQLHTGDRIFVFSDGAMEAQSEAGEEFGAERLRKLLDATSTDYPAQALSRIEDAIGSHSGISLYDDCTLFLASLR